MAEIMDSGQRNEAMFAMLKQLSEQNERMLKGLERLEDRLSAHLVECAEKYAGIERLRERMADYADAYSKHGREHTVLDERVSLLEKGSIVATTLRFDDRVSVLEKWRNELGAAQAGDAGERRTLARVWPYLLTAGGTGGAVFAGPPLLKFLAAVFGGGQ